MVLTRLGLLSTSFSFLSLGERLDLVRNLDNLVFPQVSTPSLAHYLKEEAVYR
jgi:hypothetical protein